MFTLRKLTQALTLLYSVLPHLPVAPTILQAPTCPRTFSWEHSTAVPPLPVGSFRLPDTLKPTSSRLCSSPGGNGHSHQFRSKQVILFPEPQSHACLWGVWQRMELCWRLIVSACHRVHCHTLGPAWPQSTPPSVDSATQCSRPFFPLLRLSLSHRVSILCQYRSRVTRAGCSECPVLTASSVLATPILSHMSALPLQGLYSLGRPRYMSHPLTALCGGYMPRLHSAL